MHHPAVQNLYSKIKATIAVFLFEDVSTEKIQVWLLGYSTVYHSKVLYN